MNLSEGLSRLASGVRVVGWIPGILVLASLGFESVKSWEDFGFRVLYGGVPLALAYGLAWIIDGFAKPPSSPNSRPR